MTHAWIKAMIATGNDSGASAIKVPPAIANGTVTHTIHPVHSRPRLRSDSALARGRQWTCASSGSTASGSSSRTGKPAAAIAAPSLPAGDRAAHDHEIRLARKLANLRGPSLALVEDADVALVELAAERLDGGLESDLVRGVPLGESGV